MSGTSPDLTDHELADLVEDDRLRSRPHHNEFPSSELGDETINMLNNNVAEEGTTVSKNKQMMNVNALKAKSIFFSRVQNNIFDTNSTLFENSEYIALVESIEQAVTDEEKLDMMMQENLILRSRIKKLEDKDEAIGLKNFWQRISWLVGLLMLQSVSSMILAHFHVLLQFHPVVIYFLTMLVGAGGNCGSQSAILVIRELALDPQINMRRMFKLVRVQGETGLKMAFFCAGAAFVRCCIFHGTLFDEAMAISLSMFTIVVISAVIGAVLPLMFAYYNMDPGHAGAAIQVIMDISGVLFTCVVSTLILVAFEKDSYGKNVISPIVKKHSHATLPDGASAGVDSSAAVAEEPLGSSIPAGNMLQIGESRHPTVITHSPAVMHATPPDRDSYRRTYQSDLLGRSR